MVFCHFSFKTVHFSADHRRFTPGFYQELPNSVSCLPCLEGFIAKEATYFFWKTMGRVAI
jgi:hypothetical protein